MSTDLNKALVQDLMARLSGGDIDGALGLMADDGRWWIGGKSDLFPLAGYKSRDEMREILTSLVGPMPNGLKMTIHSLIAEGDRVAAEVESYGEAGNGRLYNNHYHFLFIVANGKFSEVKEYLDTLHVKAVFLDE